MPKFFKKDKKSEEDGSNKVDKSVESASNHTITVDDWMNYQPPTETNKTNGKKNKDKKSAVYEERESDNAALILSLQEENKKLQFHIEELENNFNRIVHLENEVESLKTLLDERDSLQDELVRCRIFFLSITHSFHSKILRFIQ